MNTSDGAKPLPKYHLWQKITIFDMRPKDIEIVGFAWFKHKVQREGFDYMTEDENGNRKQYHEVTLDNCRQLYLMTIDHREDFDQLAQIEQVESRPQPRFVRGDKVYSPVDDQEFVVSAVIWDKAHCSYRYNLVLEYNRNVGKSRLERWIVRAALFEVGTEAMLCGGGFIKIKDRKFLLERHEWLYSPEGFDDKKGHFRECDLQSPEWSPRYGSK